MKIKNLLLGLGGVATMFSLSISASAAGSNIGMLISAEEISALNSQEKAAAEWFVNTYTDGVIITPTTLNKIDPATLDAIWVNADRMNVTGVPSDLAGSVVALAQYVKDGGNVFLTKHATLMVAAMGRVADNQKPNIVSSGEGGNGTDVWNVNAYLGSWQINPDNQEPDPTQIYDRRSHSIYAGMTEFAANTELNNCPHPAYPLEGTGTGAEMWREDHNCMWDLNGLEFTAEGKNTVEKFEAQNNCVVIGTWGHVQDYAVAGIVEFKPTSDYKGIIIANGLAAYEWAPKNGGNAYHANIEKLTKNTLDYLAPAKNDEGTPGEGEGEGEGNGEGEGEGNGEGEGGTNAVASVDVDSAEAVYYTVQGVRVENPSNGMFIKVAAGKATKVIVR